jgi:ABC-2 type transport system permease protein
MSGALTVARKEIRQVVGTKSSIIVALFFAVWFGGMGGPAVAVIGSGSSPGTLNTGVFYMGLVIGIFIAYLLSAQVFLREKQEGIIATLLCTPLSLREIWLGKVIGVAVPAYAITLAGIGVLIGVANIPAETLLLPSPPVVVHLLVAVPLFIASAVGLLGFIQFLFGLRENQILNIIIFAGLFFLLFFMQAVFETGMTVAWVQVGVTVVAGAALLAVTNYLAGYLSKEKIVRTIP